MRRVLATYIISKVTEYMTRSSAESHTGAIEHKLQPLFSPANELQMDMSTNLLCLLDNLFLAMKNKIEEKIKTRLT